MTKFIPTSATTYCDVVAGDINNTIDGSDYTFVQFGKGLSCLTQWEWDNEKLVNDFYILSSGYTSQNKCHIYGIWLKVNGSYEQVWEGKIYLPNNDWFDISVSRHCSGLRIAQKLDGYGSKINEVYGEEQEISGCTNPTGDEGAEICGQVQHGQDSTHKYKCVGGNWVDQGYDSSCDTGEGIAEIISVIPPGTFTPDVEFAVDIKVRNNGYHDDIFARLTNVDTGVVLEERSVDIGGNGYRTFTFMITLTQTTNFHGLVEAGHLV